MKQVKGGGADIGSQVDINSCTDEYTHSKQGVAPEVWMTATQSHSCVHVPKYMGWNRIQNSGWHK